MPPPLFFFMMQNRIDELRSLIRKEPGSRRFFQLGDLLRKVGSLAEAAEVLGKGLQHHPRYTAAWISLGRVQLKLGHYSDAEKSFARALELDPENSVSARLLGDTAAAGGDFVRAIKAYKLARALGDPELDERIEEVEALISAAEDEISVEAEEQTDVFEMDPGRDAPVTEVAPADAFDQEASAGETNEEVPLAVQPDTPAKQRPRTVVFVADEDPFGLGADVSPDVAAGDDDPYLAIKEASNRACSESMAELSEYMSSATNPFETALKLAIAGNLIDFGAYKPVNLSNGHILKTVHENMELDLVGDSPERLKELIDNSELILFVGDNAGECFLDTFLLDQLPCDRVTYAVRGKPVLNDANRSDAELAGVHNYCRLIDTGDGILLKPSQSFKKTELEDVVKIRYKIR